MSLIKRHLPRKAVLESFLQSVPSIGSAHTFLWSAHLNLWRLFTWLSPNQTVSPRGWWLGLSRSLQDPSCPGQGFGWMHGGT